MHTMRAAFECFIDWPRACIALPWASRFFLQSLSYIRLPSFNLVPIAHQFLMGLVKTLLVYAPRCKVVEGESVIFTA